MIPFAIYWDAHGTTLHARPKIALRFDGKMVSLDAITVAVPMRSDTSGRPSFVMVGDANEITIENGKATVK